MSSRRTLILVGAIVDRCDRGAPVLQLRQRASRTRPTTTPAWSTVVVAKATSPRASRRRGRSPQARSTIGRRRRSSSAGQRRSPASSDIVGQVAAIDLAANSRHRRRHVRRAGSDLQLVPVERPSRPGQRRRHGLASTRSTAWPGCVAARRLRQHHGSTTSPSHDADGDAGDTAGRPARRGRTAPQPARYLYQKVKILAVGTEPARSPVRPPPTDRRRRRPRPTGSIRPDHLRACRPEAAAVHRLGRRRTALLPVARAAGLPAAPDPGDPRRSDRRAPGRGPGQLTPYGPDGRRTGDQS